MIAYDPDLFDAQLAVERSGHAFFDKEDLAELLGISATSLSAQRARGRVPIPDHYLDPDGVRCESVGGHRRAIWTAEQAAVILMSHVDRRYRSNKEMA